MPLQGLEQGNGVTRFLFLKITVLLRGNRGRRARRRVGDQRGDHCPGERWRRLAGG